MQLGENKMNMFTLFTKIGAHVKPLHDGIWLYIYSRSATVYRIVDNDSAYRWSKYRKTGNKCKKNNAFLFINGQLKGTERVYACGLR